MHDFWPQGRNACGRNANQETFTFLFLMFAGVKSVLDETDKHI
jgi:hypothetical protein